MSLRATPCLECSEEECCYKVQTEYGVVAAAARMVLRTLYRMERMFLKGSEAAAAAAENAMQSCSLEVGFDRRILPLKVDDFAGK